MRRAGVRLRRRWGRGRALAALVPLALVLAGCGEEQNTLAPESHSSRDIASLFWWMTGGAFIGLAVVVGLMLWSYKRRATVGFGGDRTGFKPGEKRAVTTVVVLGIAVPIVVLVTLFVVSDIFVIKTTQAQAAAKESLTIVVTGHQWWWQVAYPGTTAVTANEIHIPTRTRVRVLVRSADVIHSFWVPELNRKIDLIPGRTNEVELVADKPGVYRGQCAEFCGLQHAHMSFLVFAQQRAAFRAWLANEAKPAAAPAGAEARRGEQVFLQGPCQSCHTIRGTSATGSVGPDLTHLAGRTTLGAVTIPNEKSDLAHWIRDSQQVKPGNDMPDLDLAGPQLQALLAYLEGLS